MSRSPRERTERSAGLVVFRRGRDGTREYLLLRSVKGHWDFPKGHIDPGETALGAMRRETAEEAGIRKVVLIGGFERRLRWRFRDRDVKVRKTCVYRLTRTGRRRVRLSPEHRSARWLGYREAADRLGFANARRLLAGAEAHLARKRGRR
jgi:bis(5'-nucleosidyl)-tetraphosphatase